MKITIKNWVLTQKRLDTLMENSSTINLSWRLTTKQILQKRKQRFARRRFNLLKTYWITILGWAMLVLILLWIWKPAETFWNTLETNIWWNPEYERYWVDNFQDYSRKIRLETCDRSAREVWKQTTMEELYHCATMLTLVTAYESWFMTNPRCINDNNCMWIKWTQNWHYGFMKFNSQYEWYMYFWKKFWTYHYNKSIKTFVWWFQQNDWTWKYGWSGDAPVVKERYTKFIQDRYGLVYQSLEEL